MSTGVFRRVERATPPLAALAVAVVAVSTSAILVRYSSAPSLVKAFYRVLFTTLLLVPFALRRHRDAFGRLSSRDWLVATAGGVALAIHFASWFESLEYTSVAASVTIVQSQVLFVAAGAALLLAEHVTRRTLAGMVVALCGIAVMSVGDALTGANVAGAAPLYGNALALVGAITQQRDVFAVGRQLEALRLAAVQVGAGEHPLQREVAGFTRITGCCRLGRFTRHSGRSHRQQRRTHQPFYHNAPYPRPATSHR